MSSLQENEDLLYPVKGMDEGGRKEVLCPTGRQIKWSMNI